MPLLSRVRFVALISVLAFAPLQAQIDTNIVRPAPNGMFRVNFVNQNIGNVLQVLGEIGEVNLYLANMQGVPNVSLRLNAPVAKDSLRAIIKSIALTNGLTVNDSGPLMQISNPNGAGRGGGRGNPQTAATVQLYVKRLNHASAVTLAPVLQALFNGGRGGAGRGAQAGLPAATFVTPNFTGIGGGAAGGAGGGRGGGGGDSGDGSITGLVPVPVPDISASVIAADATATQGGGGGGGQGGAGGGQGGGGGGGRGGGRAAALGALDVTQQGGPAGAAQAAVLQALLGGGGAQTVLGQTAISIGADDATNSLLILASPTDAAMIQQLVQSIDLRPAQVLIEVTIAEVQRTYDYSVGLSGTISRTKTGQTTPQATGTLPDPNAGSTASARDFVMTLVGGHGTVDFNVALSALTSRGDVKVLSLPIIIAQNNKQAVLNVGSRRPFVQVSQTVTGTTGTVNTIQYLDVSTRLQITPIINPDGYVNMAVVQTANNATNEISFDAPVISTREATTQILARDGQTAVIGGLTDNQETITHTGIPLLNRIPYIGGIFGSKSVTRSTSELFLFLTPHVVTTDDDMDRLYEKLKDGTILLKQIPLTPLIPPNPPKLLPPPDSIKPRTPPPPGTPPPPADNGRPTAAASTRSVPQYPRRGDE